MFGISTSLLLLLMSTLLGLLSVRCEAAVVSNATVIKKFEATNEMRRVLDDCPFDDFYVSYKMETPSKKWHRKMSDRERRKVMRNIHMFLEQERAKQQVVSCPV